MIASRDKVQQAAEQVARIMDEMSRKGKKAYRPTPTHPKCWHETKIVCPRCQSTSTDEGGCYSCGLRFKEV